ncbi:MAG: methyltransferase domain-containing protein [Bacilli bacterium]
MEEESFDYNICHNVLEYIDDKERVVNELSHLLKKDGILSIIKHNPYGRVMQTSVLLNDFAMAKNILEGGNSCSASYGEIKYYQDEDISSWCPSLLLSNKFGIRTFFDLQQNQEIQRDEKWQEEMIELEFLLFIILVSFIILFFQRNKKRRKIFFFPSLLRLYITTK